MRKSFPNKIQFFKRFVIVVKNKEISPDSNMAENAMLPRLTAATEEKYV